MRNILILGRWGRQGKAMWHALRVLCPNADISGADSGDDLGLAIHSNKWDLVVSCLPYNLNLRYAKACMKLGIKWADLGGHWQTSDEIHSIAKQLKVTVATDLGLAPGLVECMGVRLINMLTYVGNRPSTLKLWCGGLPQKGKFQSNFCTDGLINEYTNTCFGMRDGKTTTLKPMRDVRDIIVGTKRFEAANTSGGITSNFLRSLNNLEEIKSCDYQTLRPPGYWSQVAWEWQDVGHSRTKFKKWLEENFPADNGRKDVVYVGVETDSVTWQLKIPPTEFTAMQRATAFSAAAAVTCNCMRDYDQKILTPWDFAADSRYWRNLDKLMPEVGFLR